jgi:hypothetical protein
MNAQHKQVCLVGTALILAEKVVAGEQPRARPLSPASQAGTLTYTYDGAGRA